MKLHWIFAAVALAAASACGQPSAPVATAAEAAPAAQQTAQAAASAAPTSGAPAAFTDAEKRAAFRVVQLAPAPHGQVVNACNDPVTPNVYAVNLGGALSRAMVITVGGGASQATCYGDGVLGMVLQPQGASFRVVFTNQGGLLFSLPGQHNGVHDLMWGGPGNSMPTFRWNGSEYVNGRNVPDTEPTLQSFD